MLGIDNLKKVFSLIAQLANIGDAVGRDTSSGRWTKLLSVVGVLATIPGIDFTQVVAEFKDLDDAEKQQLLQEIDADLQLGDVALEKAIEDGLAIATDLESVIQRSVTFVQGLKNV